MKRFLFLLAFVPMWAAAQVGTFPALVGQRGTTLPTNCSIGQLFFKTDATAGQAVYQCASANTWTQEGGSGSTLVSPIITGTPTAAGATWTSIGTISAGAFNGTVGATTPNTVAGTTGAFSGGITSTKINAFLTATPITGTASIYQLFNNSGGPSYFGQNDSTGGDLSGPAYAMVIQAASGRSIVQAITGTGAVVTTSATGQSVTGYVQAQAAAGQAKTANGAFNAGSAAASSAELLTYAQAGTQKISHFWANSLGPRYQIQTLASGAQISLAPDTGGTDVLIAKAAGVDVTGTLSASSLTSTGAASGKKVVCVDTGTGILYASSTGTDCSN